MTLHDLLAARKLVVEEPGILSGTPVIRGTRVPVYAVAALLEAGTPRQEVLEMYPSVTARQLELATIYARATPVLESSRRMIPPEKYFLVEEVHGQVKIDNENCSSWLWAGYSRTSNSSTRCLKCFWKEPAQRL